MLLEYGVESNNEFALHREIVDLRKKIRNKNVEESFKFQGAKEERQEKTMSFFFFRREMRIRPMLLSVE